MISYKKNNKNFSFILKTKNPKIYKNKKLNNGNFTKFNRNDYQVFLHFISKINKMDNLGQYLPINKIKRIYILTAKEFSNTFNTDLSNSYKILNNACKKLMKTSVFLEQIDLQEVWEINICSMAKYNQDKGSIVIEFTDRIMPYLAHVTRKFLLYNLKEIANFKSLYTTRLYELIQEFKETGWILKSLLQLKNIFAIDNKFKLYGHFKHKVLTRACQEINHNYDINLKFEELKNSRKVVAIKFLFIPLCSKHTINKSKYKKYRFRVKQSQLNNKKTLFTNFKQMNLLYNVFLYFLLKFYFIQQMKKIHIC